MYSVDPHNKNISKDHSPVSSSNYANTSTSDVPTNDDVASMLNRGMVSGGSGSEEHDTEGDEEMQRLSR